MTGRRRRRVVSGLAAMSGLATVALLQLAVAPAASAQTGSVLVGDTAEAWYSTAPVSTCATPLGCPPTVPPISPYPAGTLHVGAAARQETARAYVVPDLAAAPPGVILTGGEMTLPVASNPQDGSLRPETATMKACLVTAPVTDGVEGSTETPPAIDGAFCAAARYSALELSFVVDLGPFVSRWSYGVPNFGIALVPDLSAAGPTAAWHATFNGRGRQGTARISSSLDYEIPAGETPPPAPTPSPTPPTSVVPPSTSSGPILPGGSLPPPQQSPPPPPAVGEPAGQPVAAAVPPRFQYPAAFLLPIAFLVAAVFLFRLFTEDPTPRAVRT